MKHNISVLDRIIRLLIAVIASILALFKVVSGVWLIVTAIVAFLAFITALFRFCIVYALLGIKTCKDENC